MSTVIMSANWPIDNQKACVWHLKDITLKDAVKLVKGLQSVIDDTCDDSIHPKRFIKNLLDGLRIEHIDAGFLWECMVQGWFELAMDADALLNSPTSPKVFDIEGGKLRVQGRSFTGKVLKVAIDKSDGSSSYQGLTHWEVLNLIISSNTVHIRIRFPGFKRSEELGAEILDYRGSEADLLEVCENLQKLSKGEYGDIRFPVNTVLQLLPQLTEAEAMVLLRRLLKAMPYRSDSICPEYDIQPVNKAYYTQKYGAGKKLWVKEWFTSRGKRRMRGIRLGWDMETCPDNVFTPIIDESEYKEGLYE